MQALTIGNLARAVGVSEGAIYRHFRGKKQILAGLIEDIDHRLSLQIDLIDGDPDAGLKRLEQVLKHNVAPSTQTGVSFLVIAEVLMNGDDELRRLMQAAIDKHLAMIEAQLSVGEQKGEVRPDIDLRAAALQFYGLTQAVNTLNHFGSDDFPCRETAGCCGKCSVQASRRIRRKLLGRVTLRAILGTQMCSIKFGQNGPMEEARRMK